MHALLLVVIVGVGLVYATDNVAEDTDSKGSNKGPIC